MKITQLNNNNIKEDDDKRNNIHINDEQKYEEIKISFNCFIKYNYFRWFCKYSFI